MSIWSDVLLMSLCQIECVADSFLLCLSVCFLFTGCPITVAASVSDSVNILGAEGPHSRPVSQSAVYVSLCSHAFVLFLIHLIIFLHFL